MRVALFAGVFIFLAALSACEQTASIPSYHDQQMPLERSDTSEAVSTTVSRIHARLLEIKDQYAQLSEFAGVRLGATSLEYDKGSPSWPKGKSGGPEFDVKDGCMLHLTFSYPTDRAPGMGAMDQGLYYPSEKLSYSFYLFSDQKNPQREEFEKSVRIIVKEECDTLARQLSGPSLEQVCQALTQRAGGEWRPDLHNAFSINTLIVRGCLRDRGGKTLADYHVFPISERLDPFASRALGLYGNVNAKVSILGLGPDFTVVEFLRGKQDEAVEKARRTLIETLKLSAPRVTIDMYRPVLAAGRDALEKAETRARSQTDTKNKRSIAAGQAPFIEERDSALHFAWELFTSDKTGYRVVVQRARGGRVSVLEVKTGL